jgi:hypothetical protein
VALNNITQQQEEQLALDQFRAASGLLPGHESRGADPPDFVIANAAHRIAVETTRYHKGAGEKGGSEEAAREGNERLLVSRAQTIFEAEHPDLHVEVRPYIVHGRLTRRNLKDYAPLLARAVADLAPPEPTGTQLITPVDVDWSELPDQKLIEVLNHVSITRWRSERWRPQTSSVWLIGSAGPMNNEAADLENRIRAKEEDLPRYADEFDERWLLIYSMPQASAFFDFDVLRPGMFSSRFDGVAFLDVFSGHYVLIAKR